MSKLVFESVALLLIGGCALPGAGVSQTQLPTGPFQPAIALASQHGFILASDGSLWSWGENEHGWNVLGFDDVTNQNVLRRLSLDTDWRNISASDHHALAIK